VALGLSVGELAERLQMRPIDVSRAEDGDLRPRCGWEWWEEILDTELVRWVAADGRHWSEIWPTPFEAARLRRAFSTSVALVSEPPHAGPAADTASGPATGVDPFGSHLDW
jgi:hypothetical protein